MLSLLIDLLLFTFYFSYILPVDNNLLVLAVSKSYLERKRMVLELSLVSAPSMVRIKSNVVLKFINV